MKQYFYKIALLTAAIAVGLSAGAQVVIGVNEMPLPGTALEVRNRVNNQPPAKLADTENSDKGIMFPRVAIGYRKALPPVRSTEGTNETLEERHISTGMIVYNTNPSEGLAKGLAMWNGVEWISLASSGGLSTVECNVTGQNPVRINGNYTKNISVSAQTCYIVVPVYVDEPGLYTAEAIVYEGNSTTNKATFMFTGSGEFTAAGDNYITLSGYGSPTKSTADNANIENRIELSINEKLATSCPMPTIKVEDKQAVFSILCNSVQTVYGNGKSIMQKQPLNTTTNTVSILVKVAGSPEAAAGNPALHLETDEINGVRFVLNTNATVPPNTQTFTLQGEGTPQKSGTYTYTITGNDASQTAICTANVTVGYDGDGLKVLMFSSADNLGWDLGEAYYTPSRSAIPQMLNSEYLFDFGQYPGAPFHIKDRSKIEWKRVAYTDITDSKYANIDTLKKYHLIIVSYPTVPYENVINVLCNYVKQGGTCLFTCDYGNYYGSSGLSQERVMQIINNLSNTQVTSSDTYTFQKPLNTVGDDSFTFLGGNLAVNGQYMDLTGKKLGRDGDYNFLFKNLPDDWIVLASNNTTNPRSEAKLIMHKKYRMFMSGDGGIFSGGTYNASGSANMNNVNDGAFHAVWVDYQGRPKVCDGKTPWFPPNEVYNAHFLANLIIWAFEAAVD